MDIVTVVYHKEAEGWWADSVDVPGWTAAAATFSELHALAEEGVRFAQNRVDLVVAPQLDYGEPSLVGVLQYADVTFDFLAGRTFVHPRLDKDARRRVAHWDAQPA